MGITTKFRGFCENLTIQNRGTISQRYRAITKRLNIEYWDMDSDTAFSRYVGSYGRGTAIRGFSDLDMIFLLHSSVKSHFNNYTGNGQSALLQEVKSKIQKTYPLTDVGGDGQVVVVQFSDGIKFEVVPAFENSDGSFTYPDANSGGSWKITNPLPEIRAVASREILTSGNMKRLCRMARTWKSEWTVPMGRLLIDTLADRFQSSWEYADKSLEYYDWMTRDFMKFLSNEDTSKSYWLALGSNQYIWRNGAFEAKAKKCYYRALAAIEHENDNHNWLANQKWREIYGTRFPNSWYTRASDSLGRPTSGVFRARRVFSQNP